MKHAFVAAFAALVLTAAPALGQGAPPPRTPNPAMRQQFGQMHRELEQIHQTARTTMLNALTPAHKALLAQIAGELATANQPDYDAAASRLDAALSSSEKQTILNAAQTARTQMRSKMQSMHSMMPGEGPPGHGMMSMHENAPPDAGRILLHMAVFAPEMLRMMR